MSNPLPGWYPNSRGRLQWWDGQQWRPGTEQGGDVEQPERPDQPDQPERPEDSESLQSPAPETAAASGIPPEQAPTDEGATTEAGVPPVTEPPAAPSQPGAEGAEPTPAAAAPYGYSPSAPGYAPPAPGYGPPVAAPSAANQNSMAVVALALGIGGFFFSLLASIPGIIVGHMARSRARELGGEGSGMATAGLVLSYIVTVLSFLGLILLFVFLAILIPVAVNEHDNSANALVESDLRVAAIAEETYFIQNGTYTASTTELAQFGLNPISGSAYQGGQSNLEAVTANETGYCLQATASTGKTMHYDSVTAFGDGSC